MYRPASVIVLFADGLVPTRRQAISNQHDEWTMTIVPHEPNIDITLHPWCSWQWRHNERNGVSNHQRLDCLLNRLVIRSKKTSKLRVTGLCEGNPPVTGGFPSQRASNAENVSIWWRHHVQTGREVANQPACWWVRLPTTKAAYKMSC